MHAHVTGGHIGNPKAIFASSTLLEGYTPFVDKYINNTGAKTVSLDLDDCESGTWSAYGYDTDSDFDEDDGDQDTMDIDATLAPHTSDFVYANHQRAYGVSYSSVLPPQTPPTMTSSPVLRAERFGSVWYINDAAYRTWKALLAYLYTREISFASLKSNGNLRITIDACSPKSMYRLAVKANLDGLQELAFENLRSQLTPGNVIAEVFSKFSGQHTKILDMEVKYLVDNFSDPLVYPQWQKKMAEVGRGECPHGTEVMNRVMCLMLLKGQSTT
ncbi:hypothetical protein EDD18DRAFT_1346670 [Armillaria luteobubalina]|uniref:BTB domain-containing protein n=1 Tax=Armillaria luteobubalina TaxID=153913 RepID=A0AA39QHS4_9AGAR|nr:hypothetical protein EDD18DRAFT_1346670 [Armillaria luteobubalina]